MMSFPEVVKKLNEAGVQSYYADLLRHQNVYYFTNGEAHVINYSLNSPPTAEQFDEQKVSTAVQTLQANQISYREFLNRIMAAGTQGYFVFLKGEKVIYLGRQGELFTEPFTKPRESFSSIYNNLDI
jgi:hypothetical protein